jgi:hypothetical protein
MTRGQLYSRMFWSSFLIVFAIWFLFGFDWAVPIAGQFNEATLEPYTWFEHVKETVFLFACGTSGLFFGQMWAYWGWRLAFG